MRKNEQRFARFCSLKALREYIYFYRAFIYIYIHFHDTNLKNTLQNTTQVDYRWGAIIEIDKNIFI